MKHTQGNWTVDNNNGTHGVCRIVADQKGTDRVLGIVECCGASPEREANAKLIASAPDMLNALGYCAAWVGQQASLPGCEPAARAMLNIINAAIAKAKGGE